MDFFLSVLISVLVGSTQVDSTKTFLVHPDAETDPVSKKDDAADDPAIWIWGDKPEEGLIVGTNKKWGLDIYTLKGKRTAAYALGNLNNVDIISENSEYIILAATNRTQQGIDVYHLNKLGDLKVLSQNQIPENAGDIYGICAYRAAHKGYVIATDKDGGIFKWELQQDGTLELVQQTKFKTTCEGVVADPEHNRLFVNEEDLGIWTMDLEDITQNQRVVLHTSRQIRSDLEGISIYKTDSKSGYVIFSIQGKNQYGILDRESLLYLGKFKIKGTNKVDGVQETDGLDVNATPTQDYPKGVLVVQDGDNYPYNQNFKIISFEQILNGLKNTNEK